MFGGRTYNKELDGTRLAYQLGMVRMLMSDGQWRTLAQISEAVDAPQASVSARLRDLRKPKFGGLDVEGKRVGVGGLWRYRIVKPEAAPAPAPAPKQVSEPSQLSLWWERKWGQ